MTVKQRGRIRLFRRLALLFQFSPGQKQLYLGKYDSYLPRYNCFCPGENPTGPETTIFALVGIPLARAQPFRACFNRKRLGWGWAGRMVAATGEGIGGQVIFMNPPTAILLPNG